RDQILDHRIGRRFCECRFHRPDHAGDTVPLIQKPFKVVEKDASTGLAYIEQPNLLSHECVQPGGRAVCDTRSLIEWVHEYRWHFASFKQSVTVVVCPIRIQSAIG